MHVHAIRTPVITRDDDLVATFLNSLAAASLSLSPGDVVVVAETVVATTQGRVVDVEDVKQVSPNAERLAARHAMDARVVELVLRESDEVLGGVEHVLLALKDGLLLANAGIDSSNAGGGSRVSLLPSDPWGTISQFRTALERASGVSPLGAILADSRVQPLKRGVIGGAIAVSGFHPVEDKRGQVDLFGRPLVITQVAVADDLTSAAELLMGEANEQTPFVLVKGAPVTLACDEEIDRESMLMPPSECLFVHVFKNYKNG